MRLLATAVLCLLCEPAIAQPVSAFDVVRHVRASWYDCARPGQCSRSKIMANGRRFNPDAHTCAMRPPMPLGAVIRITYRARSATCTVTDRGPAAWTGNELDMARALARSLGIVGVAVVKIQRM